MAFFKSPKVSALNQLTAVEAKPLAGAPADAGLREPLLPIGHDLARTNDGKLRVAILGCGESGKSTLFRQIRLLSEGKFCEAELEAMGSMASQALINGVAALYSEMTVVPLDLQRQRDLINHAADEVMVDHLSREVSTALRDTLTHPGFSKVFDAARPKKNLHPSVFIFADRFLSDKLWGSRGWRPSREEILAIYVRTSGIIRQTLTVGNTLEIIDTGGQRCERRKWCHAFIKSDAIIFLASIGDFDDVLYEDPAQNRLLESLDLFESLCNLPELSRKPIYLLLSKYDVFCDKLVRKRIPLNISGSFPDAPNLIGNDTAPILEWVRNAFISRRKDAHRVVHIRTVNPTCLSDVTEVLTLVQSAS